ncbi:MAG: hypothetical protein U0350_39000 [Caldilineaceae bacterium]
MRIDGLWQPEKPDPQLTFAEIIGLPTQVVDVLRQWAARGPGRGLDNGHRGN